MSPISLLVFLSFAVFLQTNADLDFSLIARAVNLFVNRECAAADNEMLEMKFPPSDIERIVDHTYQEDIYNFDGLNNCAQKLTNLTTKYHFLKFLWQQVVSHSSPITNLTIYVNYIDSLSKLIVETENYEEIRQRTEQLRKRVQFGFQIKATEQLKDIVMSGFCSNTSDFETMTSFLVKFDKDVAGLILSSVIKKAFDEMPNQDLLRCVVASREISLTATALFTFYLSFKPYQNSDKDTTMLLAEFLWRLQFQQENAELLSKSELKPVNRIIEELHLDLHRMYTDIITKQLPFHIQCLYFGKRFCLRNSAYGEYMYSPIDDKQSDSLRYVFTMIDKSADNQSYWFARKYPTEDLTFQLISDFKGENLVVSELERLESDLLDYSYNSSTKYHNAMTLIKGSTDGLQTAWNLQPKDDNFKIMHLRSQEYLCLFHLKSDTLRRFVLTSSLANSWMTLNFSNCLWKIVDC